MFEVAYVGDIPDIPYLIAEMAEVAEKDIKCYCRTRVTQMGIAVDSGTANVHPYMTLMQGLKELFRTFQRIVEK